MVPFFSGKPKLKYQAGSGRGIPGLAGSSSRRRGLPSAFFSCNFRNSLDFLGQSVAAPYQPLLFPVLISIAFSLSEEPEELTLQFLLWYIITLASFLQMIFLQLSN